MSISLTNYYCVTVAIIFFTFVFPNPTYRILFAIDDNLLGILDEIRDIQILKEERKKSNIK